LICYLDQFDKTKPVEFVPVRFATLIEAALIGDFVVLRMQLDRFALAGHLDSFNRDVHALSSEVPRWPGKNPLARLTEDAYWIEVNDYPKSVIPTSSDGQWQMTVDQLSARGDFGTTGPFFRVVSLQEVKTGNGLRPDHGRFDLRADSEYELLIDHYLPRDEPQGFQLQIVPSGKGLTSLSGSTMPFDSPYDRHWLRFATQDLLHDERAVLTVNKKDPGEEPAFQFYLPITIHGGFWTAMLLGLTAGLLLAIPQIVTAWVNPSLAQKRLRWWLWLIMLIIVANVIVGVTAALKFSKPI
jgi:hypothetical protein